MVEKRNGSPIEGSELEHPLVILVPEWVQHLNTRPGEGTSRIMKIALFYTIFTEYGCCMSHLEKTKNAK